MVDETKYTEPAATAATESPLPCYFMVADILGFSAIIKNLNGDEQNQRIADWVDLVKTIKDEVGVKDTQLISDTLFVREADSLEGLTRLLSFGQLLLERGLERNFPLRGAIVHGDAAWGHLTYGTAVMDAHTVERSLDWIGIACELESHHLDQLWDWDRVVVYPVPRKIGHVATMGAVTWKVPELGQLCFLATQNGLVDLGGYATWEVVAKLERTIQFGTYLRIGKLGGTDPRSDPGLFPMHIINKMLRAME